MFLFGVEQLAQAPQNLSSLRGRNARPIPLRAARAFTRFAHLLGARNRRNAHHIIAVGWVSTLEAFRSRWAILTPDPVSD
jgi:hypothetical protein